MTSSWGYWHGIRIPRHPEKAMSQTTASSSLDVLDSSRWDKLLALQKTTGRDFLSEVIDLYINDTPGRLEGLRQALAEQDASTAERLTHSIKGSNSNIGAPIVEKIAAELENRLSEGNFEGSEQFLKQIETETHRVCEALEALRT